MMPAIATRSRRRSGLRRPLRRLACAAGALQDALARRPRLAAAILAVITAALSPGWLELRVDNRIRSWLADAADVTDPLAAAFGDEAREFLVVVTPRGRRFDAAARREDERLARLLESVDGIDAVESVAGTLASIGVSDIAALGDGARFFDGYLLFDGRRVSMQRAWLRADAGATVVAAAARRVVDEAAPGSSIAGPAAFNARIDSVSSAASAVALPLGVAAATAILAALLRSLRLAVALSLAALLGVAWALGAIGLAGVAFNFLTVNIAVIAFVIALSLLIHPACCFRRLARRGRTPLPSAVARRVFPGCLLAAITTMVGFASFAFSHVLAVRDFGLLSAFAVACVAAAGLLAFPLLSRWSAPGAIEPTRRAVGRLVRVAGALSRRAPALWAAVGVAAIAGAHLASGIAIEHDPLDLLHRDDPYRRLCAELETTVGGLAPIEIVVTLPDVTDDAARLRLLETVERAAGGAAGSAPRSALDPLRLIASRLAGGGTGAYRLPESDAALRLVLAAARARSGDLWGLAHPDGRSYRLIVPLPVIGSRRHQELIARIESAVAAAAPSTRLRYRGVVQRLMELQDEVLRTLVASLLVAGAGIAALVGLLLGSTALGALALVVNALPILAAAALLSLLGAPLDLTTAMVASIAIGIAVDDTAHFLWERRSSGASGAATLARVGEPIILTSLVLAAGFLALTVSRFPPIARLGGLTAAALLASLAVHVLVLPALVGRTRAGAAISHQDAERDESEPRRDLEEEHTPLAAQQSR